MGRRRRRLMTCRRSAFPPSAHVYWAKHLPAFRRISLHFVRWSRRDFRLLPHSLFIPSTNKAARFTALFLKIDYNAIQCEACWRIGRVDAFRPEGHGFEYRSSRHVGQVLHLQLPVALRRVNSDTLSIGVVGSVSVRFMP